MRQGLVEAIDENMLALRFESILPLKRNGTGSLFSFLN